MIRALGEEHLLLKGDSERRITKATKKKNKEIKLTNFF